ncbi:hypothetical protein ASF69_15390 [Rhizobium sp. Leaf311]|jgi:hypothetical protein|nr:hypothetical protein ASF69_15390 [Rhizobium sp. Leaf311]
MFSLINVFQDARDHGLFPSRRNPAIGSGGVKFMNHVNRGANIRLFEKDTELKKMTSENSFVSFAGSPSTFVAAR